MPPDASPGPPAFEEVDHTADRAIVARGASLQELFENAARGMNAILGFRPDPGAAPEARRIALEAVDAEGLLVSWLSELAFLAETESLGFERFGFERFSPTALAATAFGRKAAAMEKLIKAVTYHDLAIRREGGIYTARIVFDV